MMFIPTKLSGFTCCFLFNFKTWFPFSNSPMYTQLDFTHIGVRIVSPSICFLSVGSNSLLHQVFDCLCVHIQAGFHSSIHKCYFTLEPEISLIHIGLKIVSPYIYFLSVGSNSMLHQICYCLCVHIQAVFHSSCL